jgi:pimeloyl-ACP methyl ester carboxylesterase
MRVNSSYISFVAPSCFMMFIALSQAIRVLPEPRGEYATAMGTLKLVDHSRKEIYAPTDQPRAIMTSVFYPVSHRSRNFLCPTVYIPAKSAAFYSEQYKSLGVPPDFFESLRLQFACNMTLSPSQIRKLYSLPVVLFGTGAAVSRLFYSAMAQSLASYGYIVVTLDDTYGTDFTEFPDGATVTGANLTEADVLRQVETRAADASYVLGQLSSPLILRRLVPGARNGLRVSQAVMVGHSLGGATAAHAMLSDRRLAGGLNMDGRLYGAVLDRGLDRPFLSFGTSVERIINDRTWIDMWRNSKGWKRALSLNGSAHLTFTDFPVLAKQGPLPNTPELDFGTIDGQRASDVIVSYMTAFFRFVFLGYEAETLRHSINGFPEVKFTSLD